MSERDYNATTGRLLALDFGNTALKATVLEGEREIDRRFVRGDWQAEVTALLQAWRPEGAVVCSVGPDAESVRAKLAGIEPALRVLILDAETPVPIEEDYPRATLGADRLAGVAGVAKEGETVMLVDAGTAMTIDIVDNCRHLGGNISPGIKMRLGALAQRTSLLPEVDKEGALPEYGCDTETAIRCGCVRGAAWETAGAWRRALERFGKVRLVITGGDAAIIAHLLREEGIQVEEDREAVARGMARIYSYNNDTRHE